MEEERQPNWSGIDKRKIKVKREVVLLCCLGPETHNQSFRNMNESISFNGGSKAGGQRAPISLHKNKSELFFLFESWRIEQEDIITVIGSINDMELMKEK